MDGQSEEYISLEDAMLLCDHEHVYDFIVAYMEICKKQESDAGKATIELRPFLDELEKRAEALFLNDWRVAFWKAEIERYVRNLPCPSKTAVYPMEIIIGGV